MQIYVFFVSFVMMPIRFFAHKTTLKSVKYPMNMHYGNSFKCNFVTA